jgi:hypothetical protein
MNRGATGKTKGFNDDDNGWVGCLHSSVTSQESSAYDGPSGHT